MYFRNGFYGSYPSLIYVIHSIISKDPILISYVISLYVFWVSVRLVGPCVLECKVLCPTLLKYCFGFAGYSNLFDLLRFDIYN